MATLLEIKQQLELIINNFKSCFEDFDFQTQEGLTFEDLTTQEGIEKLIKSGGEIIEFDDFKALIKPSLYSKEDDIKNSDFDWDTLAYEYEELKHKIEVLNATTEQIEENLTGDQEVGTVEYHTEEELKNKLLEYFLSENLAYEIVIYGEKHYILNNTIEKKIS